MRGEDEAMPEGISPGGTHSEAEAGAPSETGIRIVGAGAGAPSEVGIRIVGAEGVGPRLIFRAGQQRHRPGGTWATRR